MIHQPVLLKEVLEGLSVQPGANVVDGTVGQGGHAKAFLEKNAPQGKVMGIDRDPNQVENCRRELAQFGDRLILVNDSYGNIAEIAKAQAFENISGILVDLGFSSWHLEAGARGFSFQKDEPLDMRYDPSGQLTAEEIVNRWNEQDLEKILTKFGEEKFARRIAQRIVSERKATPIRTTFELVQVIKDATPSFYWHGKIHYATRTFQALRLAVNGELEELEKFLPSAIEVLAPRGRLAVISFHSLEDRIVKQFFKEQEKEGKVTIITKKPVEADMGERETNPRARSAKLRIVSKN